MGFWPGSSCALLRAFLRASACLNPLGPRRGLHHDARMRFYVRFLSCGVVLPSCLPVSCMPCYANLLRAHVCLDFGWSLRVFACGVPLGGSTRPTYAFPFASPQLGWCGSLLLALREAVRSPRRCNLKVKNLPHACFPCALLLSGSAFPLLCLSSVSACLPFLVLFSLLPPACFLAAVVGPLVGGPCLAP